MEGSPRSFVGIDWASAKHDVCVVDDDGTVKKSCVIAHTAEGLAELIRCFERLGEPTALPIAIERPSGLLVDTLVDAGFYVVPIHPNALKATRPRYSAALGKSDPGDAYILADILRTDGHRFHPLRMPSDQTKALRAAVRTRDDLVAALRSLVAEIRKLDGLIAAQLAQHPDGELLQSFPRTGTINAAQILAELGDDRLRFPTLDQLAAEAGVPPLTYSSGKHRGVSFRFACNKRLRRALTTWADNSRHGHPWAFAVYRNARQRGCDHPHAIRILARSWLRVLYSCWHNHTPYDITKHARALPFLNPDEPASAAA
ncbi:MAG: transposase [Longimicrobiales bacterium]|nr:transposase [Longimicrobiales bacterium]